ncbi:MAG: hypothetical protein AVDCRST_MAG05-1955, partial [uncultured Rubrobacteraceae bacterium]
APHGGGLRTPLETGGPRGRARPGGRFRHGVG